MSAAGFVLAINIFVAGLFTAAFGTIAWHNRNAIGARWMAIAYSLGVLNAGLEYLLPALADPGLLNTAVFAVALGAFLVCVVGLGRHYNVAVPWPALAILAIASVGINAALNDQASSASLPRALAYQLPYFAAHLLGALVVFQSRRRQPLDVTLLIFLVLSGLQFVAKPFLAVSLSYGSTQNYLSSYYGAISQTLTAFLLIANGVLMLLIMVRDEMAAITLRSETDQLSGVLNRRGFEDHTERALAALRRAGLPSALVVADLDHFKHINDTLGHHKGDAVIAAFARLLSEHADERMVIGRPGGEEFAIFIPGTNLAAARLYAEGVRTAFAAMGPQLGVSGLSASFGVAQLQPGDNWPEIQHQADLALYQAKKNGRDRVVAAEIADQETSTERRNGSDAS